MVADDLENSSETSHKDAQQAVEGDIADNETIECKSNVTDSPMKNDNAKEETEEPESEITNESIEHEFKKETPCASKEGDVPEASRSSSSNEKRIDDEKDHESPYEQEATDKEQTTFSPTLYNMKQPVPYVFFAIPSCVDNT